MKLICCECREPMAFDSTPGLDDDGSLPVTFRCPSCEWGVTLLTNPQETQLVRSLGVKIGGSTVPTAPMEMMRTFLAGHKGPAEGEEAAASSGGGKCPFAHVVEDATESG